jgi:hypothetical protein
MTRRGRPSKAATAAAVLAKPSRIAREELAPRRGRPSKAQLAARQLLEAKAEAAATMAKARWKGTTPEERSAHASSAGKLASHATIPRTCERCGGKEPSTRAMRKHSCPA